MIIGGLLLIALSIFHFLVMIKNMESLKKNWIETYAIVLEEREYKLGEVSTDDFESRELKILYYAREKEYIKYIFRPNWQLGIEEKILIKYNPDNPNIFEEIDSVKNQYENRRIIIFSLIMFIFYLLCGVVLLMYS